MKAPCKGDAFQPTMIGPTLKPSCYWCKKSTENGGKCGPVAPAVLVVK